MKWLGKPSPFHLFTDPCVINRFIFGQGWLLYTKYDFNSMSLGRRKLSPRWGGGGPGHHEFIIGSDILLIKATFLGRRFVSHTQL